MNILSQIFGIFRQRGLVATLRERRRLTGFLVAAIVLSVAGGGLYGLAMGMGLGIDTAIRDAIKVALIAALTLLLSVPLFWVAYRLLGREEQLAQVAAVPLTFLATVALILGLTSPLVFMLSVSAGFSPEAVYIHVAIVDLAVLVGLYLAGTLIYHAFAEPKGLIVPNVVGFVMLGVILVVLLSFFGPFLALRPGFSIGTDRLRDGLGMGVAQKVSESIAAATQADRLTYRFQTTNDNGDLVRDYTVTRIGDDYLLEIHTHAAPGETFRNNRRIWILGGQAYSDLAGNRVDQTAAADLRSYLEPALPPAAFALPAEFQSAAWRAYERGSRYAATGRTSAGAQAMIGLDSATGRLSDLTVGRAERGVHAEVRVSEITAAEMDRSGLEASLNQATVLGSVDRSDASMQEFVQNDTFFVVRFPRSWRPAKWEAAARRAEFSTDCGNLQGCPSLRVSVYDLEEGKGPKQYSEELANSLGLQPEYRAITAGTDLIGGQEVGVVRYLSDRTVKGEIETTQHVEFVMEGQQSRYHLDFADPQAQLEKHRALFEEMARQFTYLRAAP